MENRQFVIRHGVLAFLGIVAFFLVMKLFGLEHESWMRVFNLFIVIYMTTHLAKRLFYLHGKLEYVESLASLFAANAISVILSILGFILYVKVMDTHFIDEFKGGILWSRDTTLSTMMISLFMEGMAGSAIISFATMQYWKDLKVGRDMRIQK